MGRDEYWVAISQDGELLGGGFFFTASLVITTTSCLTGLRVRDTVDLHTAQGLPLEGMVYTVAEDVGLALVSIRPDPQAYTPAPQAGTAVKGDEWHAPFRPGPATVALGGTVDEVAHDRRQGDGRPLCVIELATEREAENYRAYAGGPVERRSDAHDPAVIGILLDPEFTRLLDAGAEDTLAAGALTTAFEVFEELKAEFLLGTMRHGLTAPVPGTVPTPVGEPDSMAGRRAEALEALEKGRFVMRGMKALESENPLVAPYTAAHYMRVTNQVCDEMFRAMWEEQERD